MAVDNWQTKEMPHILNIYSVKTDSGVFLFIWIFLFVYQFAMGWLPMHGRKHLHVSLFLLNTYFGGGYIAFYVQEQCCFHLECTRDGFFIVHDDEFCCWNFSLVLRIHRRNYVNSKRGAESMKPSWRLSCSKQSPGTETSCQKTTVCAWSWSQWRWELEVYGVCTSSVCHLSIVEKLTRRLQKGKSWRVKKCQPLVCSEDSLFLGSVPGALSQALAVSQDRFQMGENCPQWSRD